jgi:hypothetical protein
MEQQIDPMTQAYIEANQRGEGDDPNSLYADNMREEKVMNIIQQLNPDNLVEDIEHRIRGEKKNRYNQEWEKINPNSTKIISDVLVENYISFLSFVKTELDLNFRLKYLLFQTLFASKFYEVL